MQIVSFNKILEIYKLNIYVHPCQGLLLSLSENVCKYHGCQLKDEKFEGRKVKDLKIHKFLEKGFNEK